MIIVLKNADFSANNLGNIEVPVVLDAYTELAINLSGNITLTNIQKLALNVFFNKLGFVDKSGISLKMKRIYMPFVSSDVEHSLVNYATLKNTSVIPTDHYFLNDGYLKGDTSTNVAAISDGKEILDMTNSSFVFKVRKDADLKNEVCFLCGVNNTSTASYFRSLRIDLYNSYATVCDTNDRNVGRSTNFVVTGTRSSGITLDGQNAYILQSNSTSVSDAITTGFVSNSYSNTFRILYSGALNTNKIANNACFRFLAIGTALTPDELLLLRNAADELMEKF